MYSRIATREYARTVTDASATKFPWAPLLTLATATFMSITTEMLPTGLMHLMAPGLGVAESQIGLLMTVFAYSVVVTSTPLMVLLRRVPKRVLLVSVLLLFSVSTLATAFAPTYGWVLATRILTGIAQGVFWSSVTAYTATLVRPEQLTKAVSITSGGGGLAFVLGVPLGTLLGQLFGWRLTFVALAAVSIAVAALLWLVLPKARREPAASTSPIEVQPAPQAIGDTAAIVLPRRSPRSMGLVALVCVLCAIVMTGHYSFYSYVSPYLLGPVSLPEGWLPVALFGYGIAAAGATFATGLVFSGRPGIGFYTSFALFLVGGGSLALLADHQPLALAGMFLWGIAMGFTPTLLQARLLAVAPTRHRDLASALYTSAFNLGIGSGSFVGGLVLDATGLGGLGITFLAMTGLAVLLNLGIDLAAARAARPRTR